MEPNFGITRACPLAFAALLLAAVALGQEPGASPAAASPVLLGPGDLVSVRALHAAELGEKPVRVDETGYLRLPLVGRIKASGLTREQLAAEIRRQLEPLIREPEVTVDVMEVRSHPVSVLGAVRTPGVIQLQGTKRLLEVLSGAGGVDQDAGSDVRISRSRASGPLPLPPGQVSISGEFQVGEVRLQDLIEAKKPEQNIIVLPDDVITVPRAKLVYVIGEVRKAGGFVLRERESMSVLQALSLAEGLTPVAGAKNSRILRPAGNGTKTEIPVNVRDILAGKAADVALLPNDVLFVPNSAARSATLRGIESAVQMATGIVIWRR